MLPGGLPTWHPGCSEGTALASDASSPPGSLDPNVLPADPARCVGGGTGEALGALPYMYSETGALEIVWAGGCRLVWLPRPLL